MSFLKSNTVGIIQIYEMKGDAGRATLVEVGMCKDQKAVSV